MKGLEEKRRKARIAIALDVLANVDSLRVSNAGWYIADVPDGSRDENDCRKFNGDWKADARRYLKRLQKCQVCALGACMISHVKLFDKVKMGDLKIDADPLYKNKLVSDRGDSILGRFFDQDQIDKIETAFEAGTKNARPVGYDAEEFGRRYDEPKRRLKAIMANIIVNDGEFKPGE